MQTPKYVFIAGGIGITPFRSMIKYLLDTNTDLPITLLYTTNEDDTFLFQDLFEKAKKQIGLQTIYIESNQINEQTVRKYIPDITKPIFYISGPQAMVETFREKLEKIGIDETHIKTDLFSGYDDALLE
jgi:ferredoxin-NADP reductase